MPPEYSAFVEPFGRDCSVALELMQRSPEKEFWLNFESDLIYLAWLGIGSDIDRVIEPMQDRLDLYKLFLDPTPIQHSHFMQDRAELGTVVNKEMYNELICDEVAKRYWFLNKFSHMGYGEAFDKEAGLTYFTQRRIDELRVYEKLLMHQTYITKQPYDSIGDPNDTQCFWYIDNPTIDPVELRQWAETLLGKVMILMPWSHTIQEVFDHWKIERWDLQLSRKFDTIDPDYDYVAMITNYTESRINYAKVPESVKNESTT